MATEIEQALGQLQEIGGADLVNEYLDMFLEHAPMHLSTARSALQSGDGRTMARSVHTLKSNAAQVGLEALGALCASMEALAKSGNLDAVAPLLDQAARAMADAGPVLHRIRAEGLPETGL